MDTKLTDYITVDEAAKAWGVTTRMVHHYLADGRIPGAIKLSRIWMIPKNVKKPPSSRKKAKSSETFPICAEVNFNELEIFSEPFMALIDNPKLNFQVYDMLPIPIEIFSPDGISIFANRAWFKLNNITDPSLVIGKYNVKNDPVCLEILGQENMDRVFRGETCSFSDFPVPIQNLVERGVIDEKPFEAATMDMFLLPIWDDDTFVCTICFATVKNIYKGRNDIAKAQEYIKEHWQDEFDIDKIAQAVNISKRHFQRIFKEVTARTPLEYYQKVKIENIQEKLFDGNLSIEQVFDACGVDSHGTYLMLFKEKTGMSPSEYRKKNNIK